MKDMDSLGPLAILFLAIYLLTGPLSTLQNAGLLSPPPPAEPYDPYEAFRDDLAAAKAPYAWSSNEVVHRAIALAKEETGVFPERGNAAAHALMGYAILGRKVAHGASLTPEEENIVQRLTGKDSASQSYYR